MFSLQVLRQGGVLIVPLFLLSLVVMAIGLERLRFWWNWQQEGDARLQLLVGELQDQPGIQVVLHQQLLVTRLRQRLSRWDAALDLCMVLGPMLGLLATVLGVMQLLSSLGPDLLMPPGSSPVLASYGQVLIGTALGLMVALMALVVQRLCRMRRDALLDRFVQACLQRRCGVM